MNLDKIFSYPLRFISKTDNFDYVTPENLILLLGINKLQNDAKLIKKIDFTEPLSSKEELTLEKIIKNCETAINEPQIRNIHQYASKISLLDTNNTIIQEIAQAF